MKYTKKEFKKLWDDNSDIFFDDIADCATFWGLYITPRIHDMDKVLEAVLAAADCKFLEEEVIEVKEEGDDYSICKGDC